MELFSSMGAATVADLRASDEKLRDDPRTLTVLGDLLHLNLLGAVTCDSQVGVIERDNRQRAYVEMLVADSAWPFLREMMSRSEFIVMARPAWEPAGRTGNRPVPLTVERMDDGSSRFYSNTDLSPWATTNVVLNLTPTARRIAEARMDELLVTGLVVMALDPIWGRRRELLAALLKTMRKWKRDVVRPRGHG